MLSIFPGSFQNRLTALQRQRSCIAEISLAADEEGPAASGARTSVLTQQWRLTSNNNNNGLIKSTMYACVLRNVELNNYGMHPRVTGGVPSSVSRSWV
jgi:hypothetical protein